MNLSPFPCLLFVFGSSFSIALMLIPLLRRQAWYWGLVDAPDGRRKHQSKPIPLVGGIGVLGATLIGLFLAAVLGVSMAAEILSDSRLMALLGAVLVLGLIGLIDDAKGLRGRHKLVGQLFAIGLLLTIGEIRVQKIEVFGNEIDLGPFGQIFALFWLLGCVNAINLIDGMDGLLGSVGALICATIAVVAILSGQWPVAMVAIALAGGLVGFLRYNLPPASVYLGDCGSMSVGLLVGTLSLLSSTKGQTLVTLAVPVALLILPIFDTFAAIARRKLTGRSIYTTDRGHLHHCLQRRMTRGSILLLLLGLGLITSVGAVASTIWRNDLYAALSAMTVVGTLVLTRLFGYAELTLIKERLSAAFPAFRSSHRVGQRELEVQLQGNANWNLVWDALTRRADDLNLRSICLDVNAPAFHENYHARWDRFGTAADDPSQWRTEMPLYLHGQVIGRLAAAGARDRKTITEKLTAIIDLMEHAERGAHQVTAHYTLPPVAAMAKSRSSPEIEIVGVAS